jgi:hypothetical protein
MIRSLSLQFHALPDETVSMLADVISDPNVHILEFEDNKSEFRILRNDVQDIRSKADRISTLVFLLGRPTALANSVYEFVGLNPGAMSVSIGHVSGRELAESWLAARTDNEATMKRWRRTASYLRKCMRSGATAENPKTGATADARGHYFSVGAEDYYKKGFILRLWPAGNILRLPNGD